MNKALQLAAELPRSYELFGDLYPLATQGRRYSSGYWLLVGYEGESSLSTSNLLFCFMEFDVKNSTRGT
jgi:hypothetical protein